MRSSMDLLDQDDLEAADIGRFFTAMTWVRTHKPTLDLAEVGQTVVRLLESLHEAEVCARLSVALRRADLHARWLSPKAVRAAWSLCKPREEDLCAAGVAMEALRRPRQALGMYRLVADAYRANAFKQRAEARLRALEATTQ